MKREKSFTLIELLVVMAIIGLLASIVMVSLKGARERAQLAKTAVWARSVFAQLGADAVLVLNFNEGQGTTATDLSAYGNHGTLYSGATVCSNPPTAGCPTWTDGIPGFTGKALSFDGSNDYVHVADPPNLRVQTHTVEFWIKFHSIASGAWRPVLQKWAPGSDRAPGIWRHTTYPHPNAFIGDITQVT